MSGSADRINQIRSDVDAGRPFELSALEGSPHTVAGILKLLVRLMPECVSVVTEVRSANIIRPILTWELYESWLAASDMEDGPYKAEKCKELAERMPREHYLFTAFFISFLHSVDELQAHNKMSAENLAIVFGPVLMKRKVCAN